jgi:hypothetical protein
MQIGFVVYITAKKSSLTGHVASQIRGRRSREHFMEEIE